MVSERNIFNAERSRRSTRPGGEAERPRQPQISSVSLVGFLGSPQGDRAFFDGSSSSYRKAAKLGEMVGDFKLSSLGSENAVIEMGDKKFTLRVGDQLRREDSGPWAVVAGRTEILRKEGDATGGAGESTATSASPTGDADTDDALQRLLKRRQQEENK